MERRATWEVLGERVGATLARRRKAVLALLCLMYAGALAGVIVAHNPVMDEIGHLPSGVRHWTTGRFDLYKVNPPSVRLVAALPALVIGCETNWHRVSPDPQVRSEFDAGVNFLLANRDAVWSLFVLGRLALLPFGIAGLLACYRLAADVYGPIAGLLAATAWAACPNLIAYEGLILPDGPAAAMAVASALCFWRWLLTPRYGLAVIAGAALAGACLTKTTLLVLAPIWLILAMLAGASVIRRRDWRSATNLTAQFVVICVTCLYVIHAGYGFEGSMTRLREYSFTSSLLTGRGREEARWNLPGNRFVDLRLGFLPSPLPRSLLEGIDLQERDFDVGCKMYLRGEWHTTGAVWYYLYALLVKIPLGNLALIAAGLTLAAVNSRRPETAGTWFLLLHAVAILALVGSHTSCSRYVRYVLPALPFLFVAAGGVLAGARARSARWLAFTGVCLAASAGSVAWQYPHLMSYFNEAAGGPANGHYHLIDANIDWGQDLLFLRRWQDQHPEAKPFYLAYFGTLNPAWLGIEFEAPPQLRPKSARAALEPLLDDKQPVAALPAGWYAVSVNLLRGEEARVPDGSGQTVRVTKPLFATFLDREPVGRAGRSIYIYHVE